MGIQDREYMRDRAKNSVSQISSKSRIPNQSKAKTQLTLSLVRWLCIVLLVVLALGFANKPAGLYRSCELSSVQLDSNGDGDFSYDDIPISVAQIVRYPVALLIKYPHFNQVDSFFKIKNRFCNSTGAIAFASIAWMSFGLILAFLFYLLGVISRGRLNIELKNSVLSKNFILFVIAISVLSHASIKGNFNAVGNVSKPKNTEKNVQPPIVDKHRVQIEVLKLVNAARSQGARCGDEYYMPVSPLVLREELNMAAYDHAKDMAARNYFSHRSPEGVAPSDRARRRGYIWSAVGENIGKGYKSAGHVVRGWLNSPGHCKNIMNPRYSHMGLDYETGRGGVKYWVQKFGASNY